MLDTPAFDPDPHLRQLIQRAVDEAARLLDADGAFIDRLDPATGRMRTEYICGRLTKEAAELVRGIELVAGQGLYGQAVAERTILRTDDYLHDDSFPHTPEADDFARRVGITSVIAAPLLAGPDVLGVLGIYARREAAFGERQAGLAGALADHAAAAIAQSRLIAELATSHEELQERIEAERSLRDITARVAAIRDPQDVLHRIADETLRLLGCDAVHLTLMDESGEHLVPGVVVGVLDEATRSWLGPLRLGPGSGMHALAAWSGETVTSADYEADPRIPHAPEDTEAAQRMGIGAMAVVPLRAAETEVLGTLAITYRLPQEIARERRELLEALAGQAAVAVHNSRLYERLRASEAKYRLQVEQSPDLIFTTDAEGRLTYLSDDCERMSGWTADDLLGEPFRALVDPAARDEVVRGLDRTRDDPDLEQRTRFGLLRRDGQTIPVEVNATGLAAEGRFRGIHGAIRDLSVTDRLEAERRRQAADLAAAEERAHLARELHDSVTQALFSMTLTTRTVELLLRRDPAEARRQVSLLKELQRDALAEMRALIFALRPGSLEKDGLLQALRTYAAAVEQRSGLSVSVESSIEERLAPELEDALFRVGQEALHNVVKHAGATNVRMNLDQAGKQVLLSVSDDGVGFDEASVPSGHLGVAGMRARLGLIGGDLRIDSDGGRGTTIEVRAPYRLSQRVAAAPAAASAPTEAPPLA